VKQAHYRVVIQPVAKAEVAEAATWYEQQEHGLGREFLRAFRAGTAVLRRNPFQYQPVDEEDATASNLKEKNACQERFQAR
jgi:hypothetical protein